MLQNAFSVRCILANGVPISSAYPNLLGTKGYVVVVVVVVVVVPISSKIGHRHILLP
jgi:hypothetical protein